MARSSTVMNAYLGISSRSHEADVLRLLIELGAQFVGAQEGSLLVLDERQNHLIFAMTIGSTASEKALIGQRVPIGSGITGLAAQTREVQIGAPTFKTRQAKSNQPQAVLAAPMLIADRLIGVLTAVSFQRGKRFTSDDALLYGRMAAVAGVVVDQAHRLSALAGLQGGQLPPRARNREERLDHKIVNSITRLTQTKPQAKAHIAELLAEMANLVET